MKANLIIRKTLETDNNKKFIIGSDIAFSSKKDGKRYIASIKDLYDNFMIVDNIECEKEKIDETRVVYYEDIVDESCGYVSVD